MRTIGLPALVLLTGAGLAGQTAGFGGIAVNSVTGQPLSGVHLKLFTFHSGGVIRDAYGAMSGRDGRFSVTGIPPGTYALLAERRGFVHLVTVTGAIPLPSITLTAGERMTDYRLEMTPRAVMAVRVVDEYGDPVPHVMVEATPAAPHAPIAASLHGNRTAATDLRGECRISGAPGKFYLKATPSAGTKEVPEIRTDGTSDAVYGPTWYPGATSAERASAVEVEAGGDTGIEIRLVRQRTLTITGTVNGIPPGTSAMVVVSSGDRADRLTTTRSSVVRPDGRFALSNLPAMFYRVMGVVAGGGPHLQSQAVEIMPDGPDTVDLALVLTAGGELAGTVEIAGDAPGSAGEKRTVTLVPVGVSMGPAAATTEPDGSFQMTGVFAGRYRVDVRPLPANGYIRSTELDGTVLPEREVDFAAGVQGSRLKITLGRDGGQLSGTVLDKGGKPLANTVAMVILAADRDHIAPNQDGLVREGGKYSFQGIRPGRYLVFAIDAFHSGPSSEEDLKKLAAAAEEIEIKAGDRITKNLTVLVRGDGDARPEK